MRLLLLFILTTSIYPLYSSPSSQSFTEQLLSQENSNKNIPKQLLSLRSKWTKLYQKFNLLSSLDLSPNSNVPPELLPQLESLKAHIRSLYFQLESLTNDYRKKIASNPPPSPQDKELLLNSIQISFDNFSNYFDQFALTLKPYH